MSLELILSKPRKLVWTPSLRKHFTIVGFVRSQQQPGLESTVGGAGTVAPDALRVGSQHGSQQHVLAIVRDGGRRTADGGWRTVHHGAIQPCEPNILHLESLGPSWASCSTIAIATADQKLNALSCTGSTQLRSADHHNNNCISR
jgi:hypothetical protein